MPLCPAKKIEINTPYHRLQLMIRDLVYFEGKLIPNPQIFRSRMPLMTVNIVTVVKDDLAGIKKTTASIIQQNDNLCWTVVTPRDATEILAYVEQLKVAGIVTKIIQDDGFGVYPAMNQAIEQCKEDEWLWFLNAGDIFADNESYRKVLNALNTTTKKWLYGGHYLGSDSGELLAEIPAPQHFMPANQLFAKEYVSHQAVIFNGQFLKSLNGFNINYRIAADWDLMVRAWKICRGQRISESLSVFYMGGISTTKRQLANRELLQIRKMHLSRKYFIKSYMWFIYRFFRNSLVRKIEIQNPNIANQIRKIRFKYRDKLSPRS